MIQAMARIHKWHDKLLLEETITQINHCQQTVTKLANSEKNQWEYYPTLK